MSLYRHCSRVRHANRAVSPLSPKCRNAPRLNWRAIRHRTTAARLSTRIIRHPALFSGDTASSKSRNENRMVRRIPTPRRSHPQSPHRFRIKTPYILPTSRKAAKAPSIKREGQSPSPTHYNIAALYTPSTIDSTGCLAEFAVRMPHALWQQNRRFAPAIFTSSPVRSSRSASCRFSARRGRYPPASISPAARSPPRP